MYNKTNGMTLLELMVVVAIIGIIATVGVPTYRDYVLRSKISTLINLTGPYKREIQAEHDRGTIYGTTTNDYIAASATGRPEGLLSLSQHHYGCLLLEVDLEAVGLDGTTNQLILTWCPKDINGILVWNCGYDPVSAVQYLKYIPPNCQNENTTHIDTSF